jgi:beta-glucosidase
VLAIDFRQPYVLDEASRLRSAGAIVAQFGASDAALMDVLTGRHAPTGKSPFALARSAGAVVREASDAPGYAEDDTLYPFGSGWDTDGRVGGSALRVGTSLRGVREHHRIGTLRR